MKERHKGHCSLLRHFWHVDTCDANRVTVIAMYDWITILLENGADPRQELKGATTALMIAAREGRYGIVGTLLEKGSVINDAEDGGNTPLMFAAMNGHLQVVRLLLEKGARCDRVNNSGENALMLASANGHREVEELLIQAQQPGGVLNRILQSEGRSEVGPR